MVFGDLTAFIPKALQQFGTAIDQQRRVCLFRWSKILLNAQMQLLRSTLEPNAASRRSCRRLRDFLKTQQPTVEAARLRFLSLGHGHLHVIETKNFHDGRTWQTALTVTATCADGR